MKISESIFIEKAAFYDKKKTPVFSVLIMLIFEKFCDFQAAKSSWEFLKIHIKFTPHMF